MALPAMQPDRHSDQQRHPKSDGRSRAVAGTAEMHSPASCFVVGTALAGAAAVVGGDRRLARLARASVAAVLIVRGSDLPGRYHRPARAWTLSEHFGDGCAGVAELHETWEWEFADGEHGHVDRLRL